MTSSLSKGITDYRVSATWMPTRDGEALRTEISAAEQDQASPVVLIRTPYSENMQRNVPIKPLISAGFVVVVQYCRGVFGSTGTLLAFENETQDGLDAVEWVRSQPWCDGRITMMGASYLGMTQNAIAWKRPEGLVAMVQVVTTHDYRNGLVYNQGAMQLGQGIGWHQLKTAQTLQDWAAAGEDVSEELRRFARQISDPKEMYDRLPLGDRGVISETLASWKKWIDAESDSDYWSRFSFAGKQHLTAAPALHIGGWYDLFLRGTLANFSSMTSGEADPEVSRKQRLVIGPWTHVDRSGSLGIQSFPSGSENAIGLEKLQIEYLRQVINDEEPSLPAVLFYIMGADRWESAPQWPPPETSYQEWGLGSDGRLGQGDAREGTVEFTSDPMDPVPTVGGGTLISGGPESSAQFEPGIRDRSILDDRTDIVRWNSDAFDHDVELVGPVTAVLWTSANAQDADIAVHLSAVSPDGASLNIVDGYVRLKYRDGMDHSQPLTPHMPVEVTADLSATGVRIRAGWSLRVEIAGTDFPAYDRNPGTGVPASVAQASDFQTIRQSILCGGRYPSRIILPVFS